jgi:hypothetical protein
MMKVQQNRSLKSLKAFKAQRRAWSPSTHSINSGSGSMTGSKSRASARTRRQTTDDRGQQKPEPQQEPDDRGQRAEAEIAELPKSSPINFPPVADSQDHDLITL